MVVAGLSLEPQAKVATVIKVSSSALIDRLLGVLRYAFQWKSFECCNLGPGNSVFNKKITLTQQKVEKVEVLLEYIVRGLQESVRGVNLTKLYKLLYFVDFGAFATTGKPIAGLDYLRFQFGPVPIGVRDILSYMVEAGKMKTETRNSKYGNHDVYETINPSNEQLNDLYEPAELVVVNQALDYFTSSYAKQLSQETHFHASWVLTQPYKIIPYELAKSCDFDFLGYYKSGNKEDYLETQSTRRTIKNSSALQDLMENIQQLKN